MLLTFFHTPYLCSVESLGFMIQNKDDSWNNAKADKGAKTENMNCR